MPVSKFISLSITEDRPVAFQLHHIQAITPNPDGGTYVYAVGGPEPFTVTEDYDTVLALIVSVTSVLGLHELELPSFTLVETSRHTQPGNEDKPGYVNGQLTVEAQMAIDRTIKALEDHRNGSKGGI